MDERAFFLQFSVSESYMVSLEAFSEEREAIERLGDIRRGSTYLENGLMLALKRLRATGWVISPERVPEIVEQLNAFFGFVESLPGQITEYRRNFMINPLNRAEPAKRSASHAAD